MTRFAQCCAVRRDTDHEDNEWAPRSSGPVMGAESVCLIGPATSAANPIGRHAPLGLPCQVNDAELWFADNPVDLERAKALCAGCPVRGACLAGAIARREPAGVWGGQIFQSGLVIAHKRPRGRPRKDGRIPGTMAALAASCPAR